MRERLAAALAAAQVPHAEIRLRHSWTTRVAFRGRQVEYAASSQALHGTVRCQAPGGGWGVVAFQDHDDLVARVRRATDLARLAGPVSGPVRPGIPARELESADPPPDDPRHVPLREKRHLLEGLTHSLLGTDRRVADCRTAVTDQVREEWFLSSEGIWHHTLRSTVSVGGVAVAIEGGLAESATTSLVHPGGWGGAARREGLFRDLGERAVAMLHAVPVRPGAYPVVLDASAAAAITHRLMAWLGVAGRDEAVLPVGTRLGPDFLQVGDDPTAAGLPASVVMDDEGTPAQNTLVVRNGVLVGQLHTRHSAAAAGTAPTGHARAGRDGVPRALPVNSYLAVGKGTLSELVGEVATGLFLEGVGSCTVRGRSLHFRPAMARMIRRGTLAELVKPPAIDLDILALLGRLERVGGEFRWDGSDSHVDAGPAGRLRVAAGAPPVRFVELPVDTAVA